MPIDILRINFISLLTEMRPEWGVKKICPDSVKVSDKEKKDLTPIEMVRIVMTINKDDGLELYNLLDAKGDWK